MTKHPSQTAKIPTELSKLKAENARLKRKIAGLKDDIIELQLEAQGSDFRDAIAMAKKSGKGVCPNCGHAMKLWQLVIKDKPVEIAEDEMIEDE